MSGGVGCHSGNWCISSTDMEWSRQWFIIFLVCMSKSLLHSEEMEWNPRIRLVLFPAADMTDAWVCSFSRLVHSTTFNLFFVVNTVTSSSNIIRLNGFQVPEVIRCGSVDWRRPWIDELWCVCLVNPFPKYCQLTLKRCYVGVVIFRLYALWECNRRVMWAMAIGFTLAKVVLFPFAGVGIAALKGESPCICRDYVLRVHPLCWWSAALSS